MMEANGVGIAELIRVRQWIHQEAEIAFEEHKTRALCIEKLTQFGLDPGCIKTYAKTGFTADIRGTAPA